MNFKRLTVVIALLTIAEFTFVGCNGKRDSYTFPSTEIATDGVNKILISEFDHIMRREAAKEELDWRWLSAIAYQESRFKSEVRSPKGAVGLMQVMPRVAKGFGVTVKEVENPEVNIAVAVKIIKKIQETLRFGANTPYAEQLKIILACYNGGIGHVIDARRLAVKHGANHNSWNELSKYLKIKGSPEYVNDVAVRNGAFNGDETINFVEKVMNKYAQYCENVS